MSDQKWIAHALELAQRAASMNEVPVGAVLVQGGRIVGEGWNQPIANHDPTSHAEIMALRQGGKQLKNYRLTDTTLYVTLEPCAMCVGAIVHARVNQLIFGAFDPRAGAVSSVFELIDKPQLNHKVQWRGGVMADACGEVLKGFFRGRRQKTRLDEREEIDI